jgi:hypothetical protein
MFLQTFIPIFSFAAPASLKPDDNSERNVSINQNRGCRNDPFGDLRPNHPVVTQPLRGKAERHYFGKRADMFQLFTRVIKPIF